MIATDKNLVNAINSTKKWSGRTQSTVYEQLFSAVHTDYFIASSKKEFHINMSNGKDGGGIGCNEEENGRGKKQPFQ